MIRLLTILTAPLRAFRRAEGGAASVELVIVFPFFFAIFVSAFEVAMMNLRAVMMERATDIVVRQIRLNTGSNIKYNDILNAVCDLALLVPDCDTKVKIEMRPVSTDTWNIINTGLDCVKRDEDVNPIINFTNGTENELMLIRVCAVINPFFPTIGVGRSMPKHWSGGYIVSASSAFVNEPL